MAQTNILMYFYLENENDIYYEPYEYYIPKGTKWADIED